MITKWEELMMPVTSRQPRRLIDAELEQVLALAKDADSVELNLAVPDASAARPSPHWAWAPWKPRSGRCTSSTPPTQGSQVASETRAFLSGQGVDLFGEQQTKTKTALEYFAQNRGAPATA
jgi:hypothetical protein